MTEKYQFIDIDASGPGAVETAFANQVAYCLAAGAPVTGGVTPPAQ